MKKIFVLFFLIITVSFAKVDYSEMSTQELIAIMGYVEDKNKKLFLEELNSRIITMSGKEKTAYENNLLKLNE